MNDEQAKKTEFVRIAENLRIQLANIQKDKNRCLYNRKSDSRAEYSILEELEQKMSVNRKTEKTKILQQLTKIRNNVKRLQRELEDVKPTSEFVDKLKEMLEEIENAINTFKDEQRQIYEQLLKDEKIAVNELSVFEKKVELWATGSSPTEEALKLPSARISVNKTLENHLPDEVVEFERFLQQTGGRQGGWDDFIIRIFLRCGQNTEEGCPMWMKPSSMSVGEQKKMLNNMAYGTENFSFYKTEKKSQLRNGKKSSREEKKKI